MVLTRTRCGVFFTGDAHNRNSAGGLESSAGSFPIPDAAHLLQPLPPLDTTEQPHSAATDLFPFQFYSDSDRSRAQPWAKARAPTPDCPEQLPIHTSKAPGGQRTWQLITPPSCVTSIFTHIFNPFLPPQCLLFTYRKLSFLWQGFPMALYS